MIVCVDEKCTKLLLTCYLHVCMHVHTSSLDFYIHIFRRSQKPQPSTCNHLPYSKNDVLYNLQTPLNELKPRTQPALPNTTHLSQVEIRLDVWPEGGEHALHHSFQRVVVATPAHVRLQPLQQAVVDTSHLRKEGGGDGGGELRGLEVLNLFRDVWVRTSFCYVRNVFLLLVSI